MKLTIEFDTDKITREDWRIWAGYIKDIVHVEDLLIREVSKLFNGVWPFSAAHILELNPEEVEEKMGAIGVEERKEPAPRKRKHHDWTPFEDNIIRAYKKKSPRVLAKDIGAGVTGKKITMRIYWLKKKGLLNKPVLTCKDCPEARKESGHTVFCKILNVRREKSDAMCKKMFNELKGD